MWLFHLPLGNNTSLYKVLQHTVSGITSITVKLVITSAIHKLEDNIYLLAITSATISIRHITSAIDAIRHNICPTTIIKISVNIMKKNISHTPFWCYKIMYENIFHRPEEAML